MKLKRFLGYKIIFLPSGKVLGVYTISHLLMEKAAHVWESREQFFSNVQLELERAQENHRKLDWYSGLPTFLGETKPRRRFWVKEEVTALRKKVVSLESEIRSELQRQDSWSN